MVFARNASPPAAAERIELSYDELAGHLDDPTLTADYLWSVVLYFRRHGFTKPKLAERLGISYSYLVGCCYSDRPLSDQLRDRLRKVLAEPLAAEPSYVPQQRDPLDRLPEPVRDDRPIPEGSGGLLLEHFDDRYLTERSLGKKTADGYRETIKRFAHWLGRAATLGDLNDALVNRWLLALEREGVSKVTQHGLRRRLLAIWRHAFEAEAVTIQPLRVRKVRPERRLPQAWSRDEICRLLAAARAEKGSFSVGVRRADYWQAFIRCGYDTGLRLDDLRHLRREQINEQGELTWLQSKTGNEIICQVRPETLAAIDSISSPGRPFIFGSVIGRDYFFQQFRRLVKAAGLKGSAKWLRRSGATAIEREHPGMASRFLGHRSPGLASRSYIDPRQVQQAKPLPPSLEGSDTHDR